MSIDASGNFKLVWCTGILKHGTGSAIRFIFTNSGFFWRFLKLHRFLSPLHTAAPAYGARGKIHVEVVSFVPQMFFFGLLVLGRISVSGCGCCGALLAVQNMTRCALYAINDSGVSELLLKRDKGLHCCR